MGAMTLKRRRQSGGGVEPDVALGNLDFVHSVDALRQTQDGAHATVLVADLNAQVGDSPQVAIAVKGDALDIKGTAVIVV